MEIHFESGLDKNSLSNQLNQLDDNSVIVFWYVGPKGLTTECAKYYQKLFRTITNPHPKIMLYDLTAWKALFDTDHSISRSYNELDCIEEMTNSRMLSLKSKDFFDWLVSQTDGPIKNFLNLLFGNEKLFLASEHYPNTGIKFSSLKEFDNFSDYPIYDRDTGKSYSCLQYIEMLYLIEKLISMNFKEIYFALPNDELKYYDIADNNFIQDFCTFLLCVNNNIPVDLSSTKVSICAFKFGTKQHHRPYNMGNKLLDMLTNDFVKLGS